MPRVSGAGLAITSISCLFAVLFGLFFAPTLYSRLRLPDLPTVPQSPVMFSTHPAKNLAGEELDIREAAFRHQFSNNASGLRDRAAAYYLAIRELGSEDRDPSADLLKRFEGNRPPVRRVSECTSSSAKGVRDKKTGQQGLIFSTGNIRWFSDTAVEISGGYYEAGLSASGSAYYLRKTAGKWKVIKEVEHWIS